MRSVRKTRIDRGKRLGETKTEKDSARAAVAGKTTKKVTKSDQ